MLKNKEKNISTLLNKIQVLRMKGVSWKDMKDYGITNSDKNLFIKNNK